MWAYDLWFNMNLRPCSDISVFAWKQKFFLSFQKKKKIDVYTLRFWIAFARPHENTIVTDNNTTLSVHAYIMVSLSVTLFFSKAGDGNENGKKK